MERPERLLEGCYSVGLSLCGPVAKLWAYSQESPSECPFLPTALDFFSEAFRSLGQTEIWIQLGAPGSCSKPSQCLCSVVRTCGLPSSWQMCILSAYFLRQDLTGNPWVASHSRTFNLSLSSAGILGVCYRTQEKKKHILSLHSRKPCTQAPRKE